MACTDLACSIAVWLSVSSGFGAPQIAAVVDTIEEESGFDPCVIGAGVHEGLFQVRDARRRDLHSATAFPWGACVSAYHQVQWMVSELRRRPEASAFFAAKTCAAAKHVFVTGYEVRADRRPGCRRSIN